MRELRDQKIAAYGRSAQFALVGLAAFTFSVVLGLLVSEYFGSRIRVSLPTPDQIAASTQDLPVAAIFPQDQNLAAPAAAAGFVQTGVAQTGVAQTGAVQSRVVTSAPAMPEGPAKFFPSPAALPGAWLSGRRGFVVGALFGLLLGALATRLLQIKPVATSDSPDVKAALKIWSTIIAELTSTPRDAKRLLNRVRYLALVDDPLPLDLPLWRRLFSSSVAEPSPASSDHAPGDIPQAQQQTPQPAREHLPPEVLVALTVEEAAKAALPSSDDGRKASLEKKLSEAWDAHRRAYSSDTAGFVDSLRPRFSDITQGASTG